MAKNTSSKKTNNNFSLPGFPFGDPSGFMKAFFEQNTERLDSEYKGILADMFQGVSPIGIILALQDWIMHLAISPGKQQSLIKNLFEKASELDLLSPEGEKNLAQLGVRYRHDTWQVWPFNKVAEVQLARKEWWKDAADVDGVTEKHKEMVAFIFEQMIEAFSPANFLMTNPLLLNTTKEQLGKNLLRGFQFYTQDLMDKASGKKQPLTHEVGKDVAITPGKVVFQNELLELIQYSPTTDEVDKQPMLVMAPWIYKFYILDLSPKKSLIKYLVDQGKTTFAISWKNPGPEDSEVGFEDYLHNGFFAALDAVNKICPKQKVNAVGYCLGGTLLTIAAAKMAQDKDDRLNTISLFTTQTDFSEAGEIATQISEGQLEFLDNFMQKNGVLGADKMAASFSYLNPSDQVYGPAVERYMFGEETAPNELMSWNADPTRMPYKMHSEYLRSTYLNNELARNKFQVDGKEVSLSDIRTPMFNLGTETDHVAPWPSVYKTNAVVSGDVSFCLTSGGHNAGVVCGAEHPRRRYRFVTHKAGENFISPEEWVKQTEPEQGSWWPEWKKWLDEHSSGVRKPPAIGGTAKTGFKPLRDAPGEYVFG